MIRRSLIVPLFLFFFISLNFNVTGQVSKKKTDSLFSKFKGDIPGAAMMIIKDDSIVKTGFYGLANVEFRFPSRINTNYRMASVSKQFTAMAILMLIDKNKLSFQTSLKDIFSGFPEYGNKITVQHLLTHTSGLLDYENLMKEDRKEPILDHEVLELMMQQDSTKFEPGSNYSYSNTAYAILAQIVEKISGIAYSAYMKDQIFEPLKMNNSVIYQKDTKIKNRAFGYTLKDNNIHFTDQSMTSAVQGDGGVYTSLSDYYLWDQALQNNILIPEDLQKKAWTPQYLDQEKNEGYGYGWRIKFIGDVKIVSHSGHTRGFTNYVVKIPAQKLTVVIFSNRNNEDTILKIGDYLLAEYSEGLIPVPATE